MYMLADRWTRRTPPPAARQAKGAITAQKAMLGAVEGLLKLLSR